jgi:hypothetical protein
MYNGIHCISLSDWWKSKGTLKTLPYDDSVIENGENVVEYKVVDRCIMEDDVYEKMEQYMTPGKILRECDSYENFEILDVMLPYRSDKDVVETELNRVSASVIANMVKTVKTLKELDNKTVISTYLPTVNMTEWRNICTDEDSSSSSSSSCNSSDNKTMIPSDSSTTNIIVHMTERRNSCTNEYSSSSSSSADSWTSDKSVDVSLIKQQRGFGRYFVKYKQLLEDQVDKLITSIALALLLLEIKCDTQWWVFKRLKNKPHRIMSAKKDFLAKYNIPAVITSYENIQSVLALHGKTLLLIDIHGVMYGNKIENPELCKNLVCVVKTDDNCWYPGRNNACLSLLLKKST